MATKKPQQPKGVFVQMVGEQETEREKDVQENSEDRAMEEAVRDFAEGERIIKLYRYQGPLGGRPALLGGLAREDFNDVYIQERFGGGEYFGRWKNTKGQYVRFNFKIAGEPKELTKEQERENEREDGEEQPYPYLRNQGQQQDQAMNQFNMMDVLRMLEETRRESRKEMLMFIEAMKPAAPPPDATAQVFGLVKELLPLIGAGGGDGGTGNALVDGFIKLKDPIMKALETAQLALKRAPQPQPEPAQPMQPRPSQPAVTAQPSPYSESARPVQPETKVEIVQPTEGEMLADSFKGFLPMLVKAADEGQDTGLYTDLILAQVPRFMYPRVRKWLVTPGCLDDLAKFAPIIAADIQQRTWWEELRKQIILALNEELGNGDTDLQPKPHTDATAPGSADSD